MKKLSYLLGLLIFAGLVFTSCSEDEDPVPVDLSPGITFQTGGDFISSDVTINEGDSIVVGVISTSNITSGKKLESFKIYMIIDNDVQPSIIEVENIDASAFSENYSISFPDALDGVLYAEITDKDGEKNDVSFNLTVEEAFTSLGTAEPYTWQRVGGADGTGLDMFGLKWTSNAKEVHAQIKKADNGAEKFVQLGAEDWNTIETVEDLAAAVESGDDIEVYAGVSAEADGTYDDVLATKYNDVYYIIHVENGTVVVEGTGTTITITGNYKK